MVVLKCVPHVQHAYLSSLHQSNSFKNLRISFKNLKQNDTLKCVIVVAVLLSTLNGNDNATNQ